MKKIDKLILVIFSIIILVIGVFINLLAVGWLDFNTAVSLMQKAFSTNPASQIILITTEICMLLAIVAIFVDTPSKDKSKNGRDVLMQNDNGRLMISRDTIENIVDTVVSKFPGAKEAHTKITLDSENNVSVLVDLTVIEDVVIKDLTLNLQNKIKEAIKKTSDLEVKEVNVRIKNIVNKPVENEQ